MKMINCPKTTYRQHMAKVCFWSKDHSKELQQERQRLSNPQHGLIPHGIIKNTEYGRQIKVETWLMMLRADTRGKLALPRLLGKPEFGEEERNGRKVRVRLKPSPAAKAAALAEQHALIQRLQAACPNFFAGMLVPEEEEELDSLHVPG